MRFKFIVWEISILCVERYRMFIKLYHAKYARINTVLTYVQNIEKTMWIAVSNDLPFQVFEEYPKNWTHNLAIQNIPSPKEIRFPKFVLTSSFADVTQRTPMRKITNAIKKEWTDINCRLIILIELSSCFQLKYFGKKTCIRANKINKVPVILSWSSIFIKETI